MLINNTSRLTRYLQSILIGVPTWLVIGVWLLSKEFGKEFGISEEIDREKRSCCISGLAVGDVTVSW